MSTINIIHLASEVKQNEALNARKITGNNTCCLNVVCLATAKLLNSFSLTLTNPMFYSYLKTNTCIYYKKNVFNVDVPKFDNYSYDIYFIIS
jgi:hypothetical protein